MNVWECSHPGCGYRCYGTGGAVGLRAVGWWFTYGADLLCPKHRPDPIPCIEVPEHPPCEFCSAEKEADRWQQAMRTAFGFPTLPDWRGKVEQATGFPGLPH